MMINKVLVLISPWNEVSKIDEATLYRSVDLATFNYQVVQEMIRYTQQKTKKDLYAELKPNFT